MRAQDHFGWVLRRRRDDLRLTQREIAELSDFDRSYIADLERGQAHPSLGTILRLAEALKLTPAELLQQVDAAIQGDANYQPERKRPRRPRREGERDTPETTA